MAIDIQKNTLINALDNMAIFKNYYYWYKKACLIGGYVSLFFIIPLVVKLRHKKDLLESLDIFLLPITIGVILGGILVVFMYKHIYEKNIEEVEDLLKDLGEIKD